MSNKLHIVCLDNPFPPDYGGAIDMYEKIKTLAGIGKKIILHFFQYNERESLGDLELLCEKVYRYKRKHFISGPFPLPFIIGSRINQNLIKNLNEDTCPILLEGFHCSGILPFLKQPGRVVIRVHNVESVYYANMVSLEKNRIRKYYFRREGKLLTRYINNLDKNVSLACISNDDKAQLSSIGFHNTCHIPAFVSWQRPDLATGQGNYCLFHGNFYVNENERCAEWLIKEVIPFVNCSFYMAGKMSSSFISKARKIKNLKLISSPGPTEMETLIKDAQVHFIPDKLHTGIKIKLIHALFCGRFILSNQPAYHDEEAGMYGFTNASQLIEQINRLMQKSFTEENKKNRLHYLKPFDNQLNAEKLNALW